MEAARNYELQEEEAARLELVLFCHELQKEIEADKEELAENIEELRRLPFWRWMKYSDAKMEVDWYKKTIPDNTTRLQLAQSLIRKIGHQSRPGVIRQLKALDHWYDNGFLRQYYSEETRSHLLAAIAQLEGDY